MMRRVILTLLLILIFIFPVYANSGVKIYNLPILREGKVLNLPLNSYSFWFYISPGVEILDNCYLELKYSYADTLLEKESFLTIYLNGYPLYTKKVVDKTKIPVSVRVKLPKYLFKKGFNEITISTRQRSIEGLCKDLDNDANWIVIHNNSLLHLETRDKSFQIKYYPYPFLDLLAQNIVNFKFYIPKDFSKDELEVLLSIANDLGTKDRFKNLSYIVSFDDPYKANKENQIIIGDISKLTIKEEKILKEVGEDDGLIYLNKFKDNLQLYISGRGNGIRKALNYILTPIQVSLTEKNPVIVTSTIEREKAVENLKGVIRLKDLGYQNVVISGSFHQSTSFYVTVPKGYSKIQEGSFIELRFAHSPALDPEKSIITLYIDGIPVKSEKLDGKNIENGILRVNIPRDKLNQLGWNIEIKVYHHLSNVDCDKRYDEVAWTRIDGDSLFYFVGESTKETDLSDLWKRDRREIYVWLSKNPSSYELSLISTIIGKLGQITGNNYIWKVILGEDFREDLIKNNSIIFLGRFNDDRLNKISNSLWVKPEGEKFLFKKDPGLYFDGFNTEVIFQVDRSPFNKSENLYTILYNDDSSLLKTIDFLEKVNNVSKIYGQVFILTKLGNVHSFKLIGERTSLLRLFEIKPFLVYLIILIIVILITIISIYYSRKKMK